MMLAPEANLHMLTGGLRVKARVQNPELQPRKDRNGQPWIFRYRTDELQPDGGYKEVRKYHEIAPSKGEGAITKKQAEIERDKVLARLNCPSIEVAVQQIATTGVALFKNVAQMYEDGYLGRENQIAKPTREKEKFYLHEYIVPKWGKFRLNEIQPKAVEDWLHTTFGSWWTMHGVRAMMNRVYTHAEGHGLWEEGRRSPSSRAKLGRKRAKREKRILTFDETARVLKRLEDPYRLVIEICIATRHSCFVVGELCARCLVSTRFDPEHTCRRADELRRLHNGEVIGGGLSLEQLENGGGPPRGKHVIDCLQAPIVGNVYNLDPCLATEEFPDKSFASHLHMRIHSRVGIEQNHDQAFLPANPVQIKDRTFHIHTLASLVFRLPDHTSPIPNAGNRDRHKLRPDNPLVCKSLKCQRLLFAFDDDDWERGILQLRRCHTWRDVQPIGRARSSEVLLVGLGSLVFVQPVIRMIASDPIRVGV
jgi:hypothetical protein